MRPKLKRALITAYCWGIAPAWLVTWVFRVFRLRSE